MHVSRRHCTNTDVCLLFWRPFRLSLHGKGHRPSFAFSASFLPSFLGHIDRRDIDFFVYAVNIEYILELIFQFPGELYELRVHKLFALGIDCHIERDSVLSVSHICYLLSHIRRNSYAEPSRTGQERLQVHLV